MPSPEYPFSHSEFSLSPPIDIPEWKASSGLAAYDGHCMHDAIYPGHNINVRSEIINEPIQYFVGLMEAELSQYLETSEEGKTLRILDYGSGTGLVIHELLKLLESSGLGQQLDARHINLEIYAVDLPNAWFLIGKELLQYNDCVKFYSLLDESTNKIRQLDQIFPEQSINIIFSSMVFHLIPEKALPGLFQACQRILSHGGKLVWNSPDLVDDSPAGFKMHTPYRMLREEVTNLLVKQGALEDFWEQLSAVPDYRLRYLQSHLPRYRDNFNPDSLAGLDANANTYIKPDDQVPLPEQMHAYLQASFSGKWEKRYYAASEDSFYSPILVPANEGYINQLPPGLMRTWLIEVILHNQVMPELLNQSGSHSLNIGWIFGRYERG